MKPLLKNSDNVIEIKKSLKGPIVLGLKESVLGPQIEQVTKGKNLSFVGSMKLSLIKITDASSTKSTFFIRQLSRFAETNSMNLVTSLVLTS